MALIVATTVLLGIPVLTVSIIALLARDTEVLMSLVEAMFVPTTLILGGFLMNTGRRS